MDGTTTRPIIAVNRLSVRYGKVEALHGVSVSVRPGQIVSVIGPNGAGKSTLLNAIIGALPPTGQAAGEVRYRDGEVGTLPIEARVARTNMEALVERYRAEPGASPERLERLMSMLASSHRFTHAAMSLEAELAASPARSVPGAVCTFFQDVDRTLAALVATLRDQREGGHGLPDLREDHTRLLNEIGASFSLLNTETDRIANSLNTLREQIEDWAANRLELVAIESDLRSSI